MTPELKAEIDSLSQEAMARKHRFAPAGDPMFTGEAGKYFAERFAELGGFTPAISKRIGWE